VRAASNHCRRLVGSRMSRRQNAQPGGMSTRIGSQDRNWPSRQFYRRRQTWVPNIRFDPLERFSIRLSGCLFFTSPRRGEVKGGTATFSIQSYRKLL
jgi:hypothetical protein